jgi:hypothetical protein
MLTRTKRTCAALFASAALAVGIAPAAGAQQSGLVNVDIHNVLNNNNVSVTVPINAAANVCGVTVAVLADELENGPVTCRAGANQTFTIRQLQ